MQFDEFGLAELQRQLGAPFSVKIGAAVSSSFKAWSVPGMRTPCTSIEPPRALAPRSKGYYCVDATISNDVASQSS
jgi:hypothetical protein